jgi:hypothetical protein
MGVGARLLMVGTAVTLYAPAVATAWVPLVSVKVTVNVPAASPVVEV